MIVSTRYTKGAGNAAVAARLRNGVGYFWDFTLLAWGALEVVACRVGLVEIQDADPAESLYAAEVTMPAGGGWVVEILLTGTGEVLGIGSTPLDAPDNTDIAAIKAKTDNLPADPASNTQILQTQADLATGLNQVLTDTGKLLDIGQGKWEISNNQMIFYARSGAELMRFDLQDKTGAASETQVFKRVPV